MFLHEMTLKQLLAQRKELLVLKKGPKRTNLLAACNNYVKRKGAKNEKSRSKKEA